MSTGDGRPDGHGSSSETTSPAIVTHSKTDAVLTHEEAVELGRFSKGKARIDELLEMLDSRPSIEAFAGFRPVAARIIASHDVDLDSVWKNLGTRQQQADNWIKERAMIEQEAMEFDVADMERLRKLAKGKCGSPRNAAPQSLNNSRSTSTFPSVI